VDKIHVDGLCRTKDDIIIATVKDLFQAKDFQDVIVGAQKVRGKLEGLGCFRNIGIFIDTSSGPNATPEGVEVFDFILYASMIYAMTVTFMSPLVVCVDI
jgi:outer membrane protein insertion porin family